MKDIHDAERIVSDLMAKGFHSTAFQPVVSTATMRPMGFEALLRGPEGTPFAEPGGLFRNSGLLPADLMFQLDMACLGSAVRTGRNLPREAKLFINILGDTLQHLAINIEDFGGLLDDLEIEPGRIVFEISGDASQNDTRDIARCLYRFRRMDVCIALDDIGIQHPYFHRMLLLEPDYLKIDRTFIQGIDTYGRKQDLVHGMVYMADRMAAQLVAEGVETTAEFQALGVLGIHNVQGYLFGHPVSADMCVEAFKDNIANVHVGPGGSASSNPGKVHESA
jgi:EAL domain-containing protein (putative c-di-GMP-specific phosphodiesterase class I)